MYCQHKGPLITAHGKHIKTGRSGKTYIYNFILYLIYILTQAITK